MLTIIAVNVIIVVVVALTVLVTPFQHLPLILNALQTLKVAFEYLLESRPPKSNSWG